MSNELLTLWETTFPKVWSKLSPPWRPSIKDIKFWEKRIIELKRKNLKVLIFGSTPEIRDMLARNNINPTLLEANPSMYRAMSEIAKIKNKENPVFGNWLEADKIFSKNSFDVVMGDLPHCNVDYSKWPDFFTNVYNILKPGGQFLVSTACYDYPERQTVKEMLVKYAKNKKYFADFKNRLWELYQTLNEPGIMDKKYRFYIYKLRDLVKKEALKKYKPEEVDKNIWFISNDLNGQSFGKVTEVGPPLEDQIRLQSKWFYLDEILLITDHPAFRMRRSMILKSKK